MNLGIVLARRADVALARGLTCAARAAGDEVRWFVMAEGVLALDDALPAAARDDVDVTACATSADQLSVAPPPWVRLGSQDDHAALLAWAHRVVALT
ncbi:MAG: hypothetical protein R3B48_04125 [Kofleriaceae bacterium]